MYGIPKNDSSIYVTWCCVTRLIHTCNTTCACVRHDSFMCVTCSSMCVATHVCVWDSILSCVWFALPHIDRTPPPPRRGFRFTMFPHQEPCVRGPPSKNLVQILRGAGFFRSICVATNHVTHTNSIRRVLRIEFVCVTQSDTKDTHTWTNSPYRVCVCDMILSCVWRALPSVSRRRKFVCATWLIHKLWNDSFTNFGLATLTNRNKQGAKTGHTVHT